MPSMVNIWIVMLPFQKWKQNNNKSNKPNKKKKICRNNNNNKKTSTRNHFSVCVFCLKRKKLESQAPIVYHIRNELSFYNNSVCCLTAFYKMVLPKNWLTTVSVPPSSVVKMITWDTAEWPDFIGQADLLHCSIFCNKLQVPVLWGSLWKYADTIFCGCGQCKQRKHHWNSSAINLILKNKRAL